MNTTTTGELLSLFLLHAVKQVSIKIFWWHRWTTESSVVCLLLCCAFLLQCAHLFHDLMCASARMLNGKSDKNKCAIRSFLYKFGKRCFSLWSYHFHHSMCHIIKSISPHVIGLLNFDLGFDYLLLSGSFSLRYDVFNGIFEGQFMSTVFVPQCFTRGADDPDSGGKKIFRFYVLHSRELNFSLCHMVCPSARDTQANEEASKYPSRKWSQKASLGSSLSVISSLERRRILDGPCASDLTILLRKQCAPWVWRKLATSSLAGLQSWLKVMAAAQRHRVTVQINRAILKA